MFVGDAEVEDQAPAASLVLQVVLDLHVAAPLACACRDSIFCVATVYSHRTRSTQPTPAATSLALALSALFALALSPL